MTQEGANRRRVLLNLDNIFCMLVEFLFQACVEYMRGITVNIHLVEVLCVSFIHRGV